MDKVRFGIIGIGNMGSNHGERLLKGDVENGVLAAVCDRNPKRLEWAAEKLPGAAQFTDATEMFTSGLIDAVIISVPHYDHPRLAIEAFSHGLHVMCEKPAGVYTKQAREMNEAAAQTDLVFGMMFNQRTNCVYRKMHNMIKEGAVGEVRRSNWLITNWYRSQFYYDSGDWRATWAGEGGGVLLNQCPHNLDLWQWIVGMPAKVTAFCHEGKWHNIEVEDDVTAYAEYGNGATGVFITSTADSPGTNRFEVLGDKGKLVCEDDKLTYYKSAISETEFTKTNTEAFGSPAFEVIEVETDGQNEQHNGVLRAFVNKILGTGELVANGFEGINGLMISNAMHLSSWLGKTVALPIDEDLFKAELDKRVAGSQAKANVNASVAADMSGTYNS